MMEALLAPPLNPGDRICAVSHIDGSGVAHIFGYGVFIGLSPIGKEAVGPISTIARLEQYQVPKVVLDDGRIIWGTECWLERENAMRQMFLNPEVKEVETMDIDEARVKAPRFIVVKFQTFFDQGMGYLPMSVSDETYQFVENLERNGHTLRLEGEFIPDTQQFKIWIANNNTEEKDIEIVTSVQDKNSEAIKRVIERAHTRLIAWN